MAAGIRRGGMSKVTILLEGTNSSYDGAAEVWIEDQAAMVALPTSAEYVDGALAGEPNFIDMNRAEWLVTHDHIIKDGSQTSQQVKGIFSSNASRA